MLATSVLATSVLATSVASSVAVIGMVAGHSMGTALLIFSSKTNTASRSTCVSASSFVFGSILVTWKETRFARAACAKPDICAGCTTVGFTRISTTYVPGSEPNPPGATSQTTPSGLPSSAAAAGHAFSSESLSTTMVTFGVSSPAITLSASILASFLACGSEIVAKSASSATEESSVNADSVVSAGGTNDTIGDVAGPRATYEARGDGAAGVSPAGVSVVDSCSIAAFPVACAATTASAAKPETPAVLIPGIKSSSCAGSVVVDVDATPATARLPSAVASAAASTVVGLTSTVTSYAVSAEASRRRVRVLTAASHAPRLGSIFILENAETHAACSVVAVRVMASFVTFTPAIAASANSFAFACVVSSPPMSRRSASRASSAVWVFVSASAAVSSAVSSAGRNSRTCSAKALSTIAPTQVSSQAAVVPELCPPPEVMFAITSFSFFSRIAS